MDVNSNDHEAAISALAAYMEANIEGIATWGRRLKFWKDVPKQPAIFFRHIGGDDSYPGECLRLSSITVEIWVYQRTPMSGTPDISLNAIVLAIRNLLSPDSDDPDDFSLGGTVTNCRIEGRSQYDPGDLDQQGKAKIPVKITLP